MRYDQLVEKVNSLDRLLWRYMLKPEHGGFKHITPEKRHKIMQEIKDLERQLRNYRVILDFSF